MRLPITSSEILIFLFEQRLSLLDIYCFWQQGPGSGFSSGRPQITLRAPQADTNRAKPTDNRAQDQTTRDSEVVPSVQHGPLDVTYDIHKHTLLCSKHVTKSKNGSLADRGANGGVLGNDARVILLLGEAVG